MSRVDISVHVESCCTELANRSESLPSLGGGVGVIPIVWGVVRVTAGVALVVARLTLGAVGLACLTASAACQVVGLLAAPLAFGGREALGLARIGGE